jgi:hypothetical protein
MDMFNTCHISAQFCSFAGQHLGEGGAIELFSCQPIEQGACKVSECSINADLFQEQRVLCACICRVIEG